MEKNEAPLAQSNASKLDISDYKTLFWSGFVLIACLVYGFFENTARDAQRTLNGFLYSNWRDGLYPLQTFWDAELFWGNWWFNLTLGLILGSLWYFQVSSRKKEFSSIRSKKILKIMIGLGIILVSLMLISQTPSNLMDNWYPTQMAYQVPAWPALFVGFLIFLRKYLPEGSWQRWRSFPIGAVILIGIVWIIQYLPTLWDPEALTNFEMIAHLWFFTFVGLFPIVTFMLRKADAVIPRKQGFKHRRMWGYFMLSLVPLVLGQLILMWFPVGYGVSEIFSFWFRWWWIVAFWPSWLFIMIVAVGTDQILLNYQHSWKEKIGVFMGKLFGTKTQNSTNERTHMPITSQSRLSQTIKSFVVIGMILLPLYGIASYDNDPPLVLVNQVGYTPDSMKHLVFQIPTKDHDFHPSILSFGIYDVDNTLQFSGTLNYSGNYYQHDYLEGYFSNLTTSGIYYAQVEWNNIAFKSQNFKIDPNVYDLSRERAVDFYYYQRCGYDVQEIVDGYAGHAACHLDDAMVWNGSDLVYYNLTGGWHDAGDYNKYNTWFFTQWFCVRALLDAWEGDPSFYSTLENKYDTSAPDILDEALWGSSFLVRCTDREGMTPTTQGRVFRKIVDWNYAKNSSALMSYSGPPDHNTDNIPETGDERVVWNRNDPGQYAYASAESGYGFAGGLLHMARVLENYTSASSFQYPAWSYNISDMRETAHLLNETYVNDNIGTHIYAHICRLYYEQEAVFLHGNQTQANIWAEKLLNLVDVNGEDWIHSYALARLIEYYLESGQSLPSLLLEKSYSRQTLFFDTHYVGPFSVLHGVTEDGGFRLYGRPGFNGYHGIINCNRFGHLYFETMYNAVNSSATNLDLLQYELDYFLGVNPLGLCQMDAVGGQFVNTIHHRYAYAYNPSGRIAGGIINGIANLEPSASWAQAHDTDHSLEERWLAVPEEAWVDYWISNPVMGDGVDSDTNEIWIPHNAMYLEWMNAWGLYI